jgi:NTP pyrophosphatase (non-canonical NTP hydrolase)
MDLVEFEDKMRKVDLTDETEIYKYITNCIEEHMKNVNDNDGLLNICKEELAELIQAISKFMRSGEKISSHAYKLKNPVYTPTKETRLNLLEELADVYICLEFILKIANIDNDDLDKAILVKLERNKERDERGETY